MENFRLIFYPPEALNQQIPDLQCHRHQKTSFSVGNQLVHNYWLAFYPQRFHTVTDSRYEKLAAEEEAFK